MEEKGEIRVSLSTFFLILAIIIIGVMGYFLYTLHTEKETTAKEVNALNSQVADLESKIDTLQNEDKNVNTSNTTNNTYSTGNTTNKNIAEISEIENLLKKSQKWESLIVESIEESNNQYLIKANYYVPTQITETQYQEMVKNKKITLKNQEYVYRSKGDGEFSFSEYGTLYAKGNEIDSYSIEKQNNNYIAVRDIGGVQDPINEIKQNYTFYLDKDTLIDENNGTGGPREYVTLEQYLSKNSIDFSETRTWVRYGNINEQNSNMEIYLSFIN